MLYINIKEVIMYKRRQPEHKFAANYSIPTHPKIPNNVVLT